MHDSATEHWNTLRHRWRHHLQRVRELMDDHCRAAMTATGGKIRPAVRIFGDRIAADAELQREMRRAEDLATQLGLLPPVVPQNPKAPKRAMSDDDADREAHAEKHGFALEIVEGDNQSAAYHAAYDAE